MTPVSSADREDMQTKWVHALSGSLPFLKVNFLSKRDNLLVYSSSRRGLVVWVFWLLWFKTLHHIMIGICCRQSNGPQRCPTTPGICEYVTLHGKGELLLQMELSLLIS